MHTLPVLERDRMREKKNPPLNWNPFKWIKEYSQSKSYWGNPAGSLVTRVRSYCYDYNGDPRNVW